MRALKEGVEQCAIHTQLTEAIRAEDGERLAKKEKEALDWERDNTRRSPYHIIKERACPPSECDSVYCLTPDASGLTVAQVKLQTAQAHGKAKEQAAETAAETAATQDGTGGLPFTEDDETAHNMAQFILRGLDIEAEQ